jgi:hypothetical protein
MPQSRSQRKCALRVKLRVNLLRSAFDDIEVTDEEKGYGKIKMGEMEVGDKRAEVFGIVDKNGSHFELKKEV